MQSENLLLKVLRELTLESTAIMDVGVVSIRIYRELGVTESLSNAWVILPPTTQSLFLGSKRKSQSSQGLTRPAWSAPAHLPDLTPHPFPLLYSASAMLASLLLLRHTRQTPASGPLHLLFPLPGMLSS